ncbi:MAG: DUF721 domain-containing protein [Candidatus Babeliales bacterium]
MSKILLLKNIFIEAFFGTVYTYTMPHLIKEFLTSYIAEQKNWKALLLQQWPTIIGTLRERVTLEKIEDDMLVLGVYDSSWMQELYLLTPVILQTINANLDQPRIKRLRFKQVGRKKNKETGKEFSQKVNPETKILLTQQENDALANIKDEHLRDVLKKFLIRCYQEKE